MQPTLDGFDKEIQILEEQIAEVKRQKELLRTLRNRCLNKEKYCKFTYERGTRYCTTHKQLFKIEGADFLEPKYDPVIEEVLIG